MQKQFLWVLITTIGGMLCCSLGWTAEIDNLGYQQGVQAYRQGDYLRAEEIFKAFTQQEPENMNGIYYLAITQAQLGHYPEAASLYQQVLDAAPQSRIAELAQKGLTSLPSSLEALDPPPQFNASGSPSPQAPVHSTPQAMMSPASLPNPALQQQMQWMQLMQMLSNPNNSQNNPMSGMTGGVSPWMFQNDPSQMPGMGAASGMDPSMMSTMMMNQMMQNFDFGGNDKDNR